MVALAEASARAAEQAGPAQAPALRAHADEERSHVALWDEFARAARSCEAPSADQPTPAETGECVRAWTAGEDLLEHLAVLYAIEAGQPEISRTKMDGLTAHYGYQQEGPAVAYFRLHEQLDLRARPPGTRS